MRVWPWRAQSAFVLCFKRHRYKPDQGQPRNPFCLQTAAPKLLGVFRVSGTELPKRSLAISWGHTTLTDTEAEQAQQQQAQPGLEASSQLWHWLQQSPRKPAGSAAVGPHCSQRLTKNCALQQASAAP